MKNIETTTLIEVEGAVLSSQAIQRIKKYQDANNDQLNVTRDGLSEVICWIALSLAELSEEHALEAKDHMCFLSYLRNDINCFKKP
jgi:hypothetical protein